jgi:chromosome segregation ATPase
MIEKIKIGDQEISVKENPELLKLVESVRKEEKDKLYGEITSLKSTVAELKAKSGKTPEELKELEELKTKLKSLETEKTSKDKELDELRKSMEEDKKKKQSEKSGEEKEKEVEAILAKLEQTLEAKLKPVEERLSKIADTTAKVTVAGKRKELLEKHKGYLIPELLSGNTVEELENNLKDALEVSKNYITVKNDKGKTVTLAEMEKMKAKAEEGKKKEEPKEKIIVVTGDGSGHYVPPMPPDGGSKKPEEMVKSMGEMSLEEFTKNKDVLKKQLMEQMKGGE